MTRERVAVVGAGVSGLTAAYLLRHGYDVTLFESSPKLGGHADTHEVRTPDGALVPIDTGFIVHNDHTYPHLARLFAQLDVPTRGCPMSMSVRCRECGLEYAGGRRGAGLLASAGRAAWPRYLRMLAEIPRFYRAANAQLSGSDGGNASLGEFLTAGGYSRYFVDHFALPLVAAVWSAGEEVSLRYPAGYLFAFLRNHGMLGVEVPFTWRTVVGGSRVYVERISEQLPAIRVDTPVRAVRRHADGVDVVDDSGSTHFVDRIVIATHADQALALLADPTRHEKQILGAFEYARNEAWLHTDPSVLPRNPRVRAAWNHLKPACRGAGRVLVSYHMNRLMQLSEPVDYVVTLNGSSSVDASSLIATRVYEHPIYTCESVEAQRRLPELTGARIAFAGAYQGWGFHEDGCASGVRAACAFGIRWP